MEENRSKWVVTLRTPSYVGGSREVISRSMVVARARWKCTLPTDGMRSIISTVSISLEGFLASILLLVMIIVVVVIVAVILVVVVVAIVGVVIVV
ncbi:hypothetical protein Tco_0738106, partial [Tanacetum coccineum]